MNATLAPLGIIIAIVFVAAMGLLFFWMFRVPPKMTLEVASVRSAVAGLQRILVPVSGPIASERAVELACRLGEAQKAEIILAYIVEVPLTLALGTAMPEETAKGQAALETGRQIVEQHDLPVRTMIVPQRYAWDGILHIAEEEKVDAIVMSMGRRRRRPMETLGRTTTEVLKRAKCEVILDKAPVWV